MCVVYVCEKEGDEGKCEEVEYVYRVCGIYVRLSKLRAPISEFSLE